MIDLAQIAPLIVAWKPFGLAAIFFGLLLEGEVIIFTAMFLAQHGVFGIPETAAVTLAGVALNDFFWHRLGRASGILPVSLRNFFSRIAAPIDGLLETRTFQTLLFTKFTYGLMRPTIIRTGMTLMPTKKFLRYDYPAAFLWIATIGGLGYFSGISLEFLKHYFKIAEMILLIPLVSFFILWHLIIKNYLNKQTGVDS